MLDDRRRTKETQAFSDRLNVSCFTWRVSFSWPTLLHSRRSFWQCDSRDVAYDFCSFVVNDQRRNDFSPIIQRILQLHFTLRICREESLLQQQTSRRIRRNGRFAKWIKDDTDIASLWSRISTWFYHQNYAGNSFEIPRRFSTSELWPRTQSRGTWRTTSKYFTWTEK